MAIPKFDQLSGSESLTELIEMVAKLQKQVQWLMDGKISSENVREMGGWVVNNTELVANDGDVGLSTEDTAGDDVRLWAGDIAKDAAPWRVLKSGKMVATGALIQSKEGYPKVELDPNSNLLKASSAEDMFILITPLSGSIGTPAMQFYDGYTPDSMTMYLDPSISTFVMQATLNIEINAQMNDLHLVGATVRVPSWSQVINSTTGQSLQDALNAAMASPAPPPSTA